MFLFNFVKILLFILFIYFIFNVIRGLININRTVNKKRNNQEDINKKNKSDDHVIELDKDQYKVE